MDSIVTPSSLQHIVKVLAADSMKGRYTGSPQAVQAAYFIANEFEKAGGAPMAGNDGYFMPFYVDGIAMNVVTVLPGKSKADEMVIFSAHYDHIGIKREKEDSIYNGANDNASGVSGLIHLLRFFAQQNDNERTIVFIAFSGEELGLLGSQYAVKRFEADKVMAMINMDMIGRPLSRKNKNPYITGSDWSDLRRILNKRLFEEAPEYGKNYFNIDRFIAENLFRRSDNYWFALNGIPAHTVITSSPSDRYYHSKDDEADKVDAALMARVVKGIALGSMGLVKGTDTPKRLNPAGLRQ